MMGNNSSHLKSLKTKIFANVRLGPSLGQIQPVAGINRLITTFPWVSVNNGNIGINNNILYKYASIKKETIHYHKMERQHKKNILYRKVCEMS